MCFYNDDYDWTAQVCEITRFRTNKRRRCDDCFEVIEVFDWFTLIFMQEKEECSICEENDNDPDLTPEECEHECDFGECCEIYLCEDCRLIRHAIIEVEREEGCPPDARQPGYGELQEAFSEHDGALSYANRAISLFPHLESNKILKLAIKDV